MKKSHKNNRSGSTLIIVVLFMGLLVGLAILFLLSSLTASKLSNTSASGEKTTNLAMGASDIIIGDLRQEIKDGSTLPTGEPTTGYPGSSTGIVYPVYQPKPSAGTGAVSTAVPSIVGFTPQFTTTAPYYESDGLANLLKISKYNLAFYNDPSNPNSNFTAVGVSRASNVSTSYPSLDGKVITPARWNSHFLIQRQSQGYGLDSTPIGNQASTSPEGAAITTFPEQPDWVIVTRSGAQKAYANSPASLTTLSDPSNSQYAVGRFAYAIYNEGGLLDMNAAGYPSQLTAQQTSQKSSLAFADLTQLSLTLGGTPFLNQTQVDQIVGWRNAYTAQLSGSGASAQFGSIQFTSSSATSWINNFAVYNNCQTNSLLPNFGLKNGFTAANGNPLSVNGSVIQQQLSGSNGSLMDQMFISRSQLISLIESLGTQNQTPYPVKPDVLQYMGTFSRSIEQPSYAPSALRPLIGGVKNGQNQGLQFASAAPPHPHSWNVGTDEQFYDGNNDMQNFDNTFNPAFLSVRVQTPFVRLNGQTANVGEPLVLYRFPLSNLAMVAYNATNTSVEQGSVPGFKKTSSDLDPVWDHFGLKRTDSSAPWIYNHGSASILSLSAVAAQGREPDFAELLKAAITVGALGKGAPNTTSSLYNDSQYAIDTVTDYQVLQIMANLIDQQDADSYPTCIQINTGYAGTTVIEGVEDLPYFYRFHLLSVYDVAPSVPIISNAATPISITPSTATGTSSGLPSTRTVNLDAMWTFPGGAQKTSTVNSPITSTNGSTFSIGPAEFLGTSHTSPSSLGDIAYMYIPDLWNPHDPSTALQAQNLRPTNFRVFAQTADPTAIPSYSNSSPTLSFPWSIGSELEGFTGTSPKSILPENNTTAFGSNPIANGATFYYWPISPVNPFSLATTEMDFSDNNGVLFREPTLIWNKNPKGLNLSPVGSLIPKNGLTDLNTGATYYGIVAGRTPIMTSIFLSSTQPITSNAAGNSQDGEYAIQGVNMDYLPYNSGTGTLYQQITFVLQYQDQNQNWITYDAKYSDQHGISGPNAVINPIDYGGPGAANQTNKYENPFNDGQMQTPVCCIDPRTARWSVASNQTIGQVGTYDSGNGSGLYSAAQLLEPSGNLYQTVNQTPGNQIANDNKLFGLVNQHTPFSVMETARPRADKGNSIGESEPGQATTAGILVNMRAFGGPSFYANNTVQYFSGMFSQNDPSVPVAAAANNSSYSSTYFEDADGIARRAMGAYVQFPMTSSFSSVNPAQNIITKSSSSAAPYKMIEDPTFPGTNSSQSGSPSDLALAINPGSFPSSNSRIGLPEATASKFDSTADPTPQQQAQSRDIILNRPFRSVSEMSYAFTGTPWKNIDFFTPESGYSALLDTFCVGQPPANGLVAGKVDLNTRQAPVIQAVVAGANKDEWYNLPSTASPASLAPPDALHPITSTEAGIIAQRLVAFTSDNKDAWRGPLSNVSELVGRYINPTSMPGNPTVIATGASPDWYTYNAPATSVAANSLNTASGTSFTYAGFTSLLDSTVYTDTTNNSNLVAPIIQRFKEAGLRPLADCGQTRVWNLLIDVIAQSGKYPKSSTGLDQFAVDGEKRMWIHLAIDRQTGEVLDKQIEVVNQ